MAALKEKLIPIGTGAVATTIVASIFFMAYVYLLIAEPVRSTILSDESLDTLLASVLIFFALDAAILFFLPPIVTTLLYERKFPKSDFKDLIVMGFASSALTMLMVIALLHIYSEGGFKDLSTGQTAICCPIAVLFWCILSGFVGPAALWIKNKFLKRSK